MATMNISLPDTLKSYIDDRVSNDGYGNASEYFRDLIRQGQKRKELELLERAQLEKLKEEVQAGMAALRAGKFTEYDSAETLIGDIEKEGKKRVETRKNKKHQ